MRSQYWEKYNFRWISDFYMVAVVNKSIVAGHNLRKEDCIVANWVKFLLGSSVTPCPPFSCPCGSIPTKFHNSDKCLNPWNCWNLISMLIASLICSLKWDGELWQVLVELAHICLFQRCTTECEYSLLHNLMHTRYIFCVVKTINGTHPNPSDKVFPRNVREIVGAMHL